jgi:syntaxin 7
MSFDRLNSLEAQPTTMRRDEDPQYRDDPGFDHLAETLSDQLFTLTSNISRLSNQIALLGTKRDTERVRERVHNLLEETRAGFKDVGEGIKKVQTWEDVNVWLNSFPCFWERLTLTLTVPALPEVDTTEAII